jgi:hypothetical protein
VYLFVWLLPLDLSGMGASTSSYATAGIALRVSGALKPHHHDKVETPLMGIYIYNQANMCSEKAVINYCIRNRIPINQSLPRSLLTALYYGLCVCEVTEAKNATSERRVKVKGKAIPVRGHGGS